MPDRLKARFAREEGVIWAREARFESKLGRYSLCWRT